MIQITSGEMQKRDDWIKEWLIGSRHPFSFVYGGQPSEKLLNDWQLITTSQKLDDARIQHVFSWSNPGKDELSVRCVAVEYLDFPALEWTVHLKNTGEQDTPILETVQALDMEIKSGLERWQEPEFVLHGIKGDSCTPDSYQPYHEVLNPDASRKFTSTGGRPTNGAFPYYNLQMPGGGLILALGWPGQWAASFTRSAANPAAISQSLHIAAGQELTHFYLKAGEEIRTPLVVLFFWQGEDVARAQNLWRRWMLAHNTPHPGGKPPAPIFSFCSGGFFPGLKVSEESEKLFIDTLARVGVKPDYWWMDAGWYPCDEWPHTGTWEVDALRFPNGIRAVSDYVHDRGIQLIVWFEPERVTDGSWLATNHPEWLLGGKLLNLGNAEARRWLTEHVDYLLVEQGIDLYRQDFNMDPLDYWRANDTPDRQGITENFHVQGYLAYWDELLRRHPGMLIDSCASGGRRNDLETLRRALPLLRSDYQSFDGNPALAPGNQGHTYGLSAWIPWYGQGVYFTPQLPVYCVRSHMSPAFGIAVDVRREGVDWELYRRLLDQWRQVVDLFLGDYYPLTPYSLDEESWIAWQFDCPDQGDGVVQAFRRTKNEEAVQSLRLRGLDPSAAYRVNDVDGDVSVQATGRELMEQGLKVEIVDKPGAVVIMYKKLAQVDK